MCATIANFSASKKSYKASDFFTFSKKEVSKEQRMKQEIFFLESLTQIMGGEVIG